MRTGFKFPQATESYRLLPMILVTFFDPIIEKHKHSRTNVVSL